MSTAPCIVLRIRCKIKCVCWVNESHLKSSSKFISCLYPFHELTATFTALDLSTL